VKCETRGDEIKGERAGEERRENRRVEKREEMWVWQWDIVSSAWGQQCGLITYTPGGRPLREKSINIIHSNTINFHN